MSTQPATIAVDGWDIASTSETADEMKVTHAPAEPESKEPVETKDGQPVEENDSERISKAAAELGKKGGEAAAAKRASEAKEKPKEEPADLAAKEQEAKEEEKPLGKPRDDPRARMLEATRKEAEAKREAARERAQREALERRLAEVERRVAPEPAKEEPRRQAAPADDPEPKADDFEDYAEYVEKRARWGARQETREYERKAAARAQAAEFTNHVASVVQKHAARVKEARQADPDFANRLSPEVRALYPSIDVDYEHGERLEASHVVADEIIRSEHGPALMLHFSDQPDDLQRILALRTPDEVKVEVRLIARSLEAATAGVSSKPEVSKAKPPVRPVTGSPITADSEPDENDSYDEHVRKMNAKERRKR